jgi:phenylalanyl-tRNA synthetase beta chain
MTTQTRSESARGPFAVRRALASLGYQETINFSFVEERWETELAGNPQPIKLLNPIASQMGVMRSSLLGSLLRVLKFNLDRKAPRVNVFELGRVFLRDAQIQNTDTTVAGFDQPMRVGGLAWGPRSPLHWDASEKGVDFFDVKGDIQALLAPADCVFAAAEHPAMHPGRCASVQLAGRLVGYIGELHPKWCQQYELTQSPVLFELELDAVLRRHVPVFQPISKLQSVERDIAVIVAEAVTHDACIGAVRSADTRGLLKNACVFDIYRPQAKLSGSQALQSGEKSIAIRLELASDAATLTEADIDQAVKSVLAKLEQDVRARLRA